MDESIFDFEQEQEQEQIAPIRADIIAFTDGSCVTKPAKSAGCGVYFYEEENKHGLNEVKIIEHMPKSEILYTNIDNEIIFSGDELEFTEYCGHDDCANIGYARNSDGLACSKHKGKNSTVVASYERYHPTNIRAEGNAILIAMRALINKLQGKSLKNNNFSIVGTAITGIKYSQQKETTTSFMIVTDSKFWIDLLTDWLPKWITYKKLMERKNIDLIVKLNDARSKLLSLGIELKFVHVYGHQDDKKEELSVEEKGNVLADKLATHASAMTRHGIFVIN